MNFILDTNVYRELFGQSNDSVNILKIEQLKRFSKENNCTFLLSTVVLKEHIRHLGKEEPARSICFKSIQGLFTIHGISVHLVPEYKDIISLFVGKSTKMNMELVDFCYEVSELEDISKLQTNQLSFIAELKKYRENELQNLINNIKDHFFSKFSEHGLNWNAISYDQKEKAFFMKFYTDKIFHNIIAMAYLKTAFNKNEVISDEIRYKFMTCFPVTIDFFVKRIILKASTIGEPENFWNLNKKKARDTWNSHFDAQLVMACEYMNYSDSTCPTIFVSKEKSIPLSFDAYEKSSLFMNYEEFLKFFSIEAIIS
jgi:hypothetical protein